MNSIQPVKALTNVNQIKSEFSIYCWCPEEDINYHNFYKTDVGDKMFYLNKRILYFMQLTNKQLKEYKGIDNNWCLNVNNIVHYIKNEKEIPKRYHPQVIDITKQMKKNYIVGLKLKLKDTRKQAKWIRIENPNEKEVNYYEKQVIIMENLLKKKNFEDIVEYIGVRVLELRFKYSIISLMEQKNLEPNIVAFFKDFTKKQGMEFDDYIDSEVKRVINKYFV